jgi:hypothetical protein
MSMNDGDKAACDAEFNIGQLTAIAETKGISAEALAQIATAHANLAIAAYLRALVQTLESR